MPYVDKKRPGVLRAQVKFKVDGKLTKHFKDFPLSARREAIAWEVQKRKELQEQTPTIQTGTALLDFCNRYLDHCELRYTRKVFKEKKSLCEALVKRWGALLVEDVTSELVNTYLQEIARSKSANRHNKDRKNLLAMWNWGQKILDLPSNPVAKIDRLPHDREPQYTPPTSDILKVLAAANREERVFLNCYLLTGARRSEIFRWTWNDDINFDKRQVRLGTRKTADGSMSYEWLPMNDELYEDLWSWWNNRPIKDPTFVFVSTSNRHHGQPFTTRRQFMRGICKRAGVKEFGFHALRRYVASYLADDQKVSAKSIQRLLRHKNLHTTEKYIGNINDDLRAITGLLSSKGLQDGPPKTIKGLGNEP
jgi:integrase